eukprot:gnl/TRDRNA2_/TRDRNA2_45418_c0_seq1.p1 gnl/TRDRNA2_/TRDRNA2_45418_c0~~gnl/TRDRNA2_/TRDRNA2_45418_c0_seq1.p1  ORF type:complete len:147 (-),score=18.57 gnl/TRDRNA2_/TRDRNA2_45418_c0_seq1:5-445(-)
MSMDTDDVHAAPGPQKLAVNVPCAECQDAHERFELGDMLKQHMLKHQQFLGPSPDHESPSPSQLSSPCLSRASSKDTDRSASHRGSLLHRGVAAARDLRRRMTPSKSREPKGERRILTVSELLRDQDQRVIHKHLGYHMPVQSACS